jgi:hypothetical protein
LGLGRQIGQINSGAFGVFSAKLSKAIKLLHSFEIISTHFGTVSTMFSIIQPLFLQQT